MADDFDPFAANGYAAPPPKPVVPQGNFDPFAAAGYVVPAASLPASAMTQGPAPIPGGEFGGPIFDTSTPEGAAAERQAQHGVAQASEKVGEGMTFGMLPHIIAGARAIGGTPYSQGLQEARDYTAQTSKDQPFLSGLMEGAGGMVPTAASFGLAGPAIAAARGAVGGGGALARAWLSAGLGGANAAGHDIGAGTTDTLGRDTATGAGIGAALSGGADLLGGALQAVPNAARSLYAGGRNIFTDTGRQGVVGQVLREAGGDFQNQAARSPISGLELRAPQATGNPGLANLERALASEPSIQSGPAESLVTGNRTPDQTSALGRALVGADARIEPSVLTNQASARGVQAIQNLNDALHGTERSLWQAPEMRSVQLNAPGLAAGVGKDIAAFPASWRDAVTGPQGKLGAYLRELHDLGPNATIPEVNSVRSRLLGAARDASSGPQPDSVTAAAANKMARSIIDRMGEDPAIAGAAGTVRAPVTEMHMLPGDTAPTPVQIGGTSTPGTPANPSAWAAYQRARDFTHQFNDAKGYNEFNGILHPNSQGNMQGNAEKQFGQFVDTAGGTSAGLERLQGLADFARQAGHTGPASELENATRQYLNASILRQSRAGSGLDATGQPSLNLASLASTTNRMAPALNATPMTAPMAGDVQAVGNAAELLNRPSMMRGDANSTTFEKLKQNDMVNAILGQSATSGLGGVAGGYAGYQYGPEGVPAYLRIPGGALAGALMANTAGPSVGHMLAHTPVLRGIGAGPSTAIREQIMEALSNMPAYNRAIATPMLSGPTLGTPGALSRALAAAGQGALVPATGRSGR